MKKAIIAHCWGGSSEYCWYPYVRKELESLGFDVSVPNFPDTEEPNLKKWLPVLTSAIGEPNEDTFLIGHSAGSVTILRYLEGLPEGAKIGGMVLVAGFTNDLGMEELENFFKTELDFEKIKNKAKHFVVIQSDDDPYVPMIEADKLEKELNAKKIVKHNMKHFSGASDGEVACTELPDVIEGIKEMV